MKLVRKTAGWQNTVTVQRGNFEVINAMIKIVELVAGRPGLQPYLFRVFRSPQQRQYIKAEFSICHQGNVIRFLVDFELKGGGLVYPQGLMFVWVEDPESREALPIYVDASASHNWCNLLLCNQTVGTVAQFRKKAGL
jgi:hypothetical protein